MNLLVRELILCYVTSQTVVLRDIEPSVEESKQWYWHWSYICPIVEGDVEEPKVYADLGEVSEEVNLLRIQVARLRDEKGFLEMRMEVMEKRYESRLDVLRTRVDRLEELCSKGGLEKSGDNEKMENEENQDSGDDEKSVHDEENEDSGDDEQNSLDDESEKNEQGVEKSEIDGSKKGENSLSMLREGIDWENPVAVCEKMLALVRIQGDNKGVAVEVSDDNDIGVVVTEGIKSYKRKRKARSETAKKRVRVVKNVKAMKFFNRCQKIEGAESFDDAAQPNPLKKADVKCLVEMWEFLEEFVNDPE